MSYDPNNINISTRKISVHRLIPEICFQNNRSTWKDAQKSRLIESILVRIPLQSFYVNGAIRGDNKNLWTIIDGQKRLLAIKEYYVDRTFRLQGLEYLTILEGKSFDEIERRYQRRLLETELTIHSIDTGTPSGVYKSICQRIIGDF
jgi:hypothetical protein